ncbi:hypothetical protein BH23VER1_BH23VER1_14520 [soil metagenome]
MSARILAAIAFGCLFVTPASAQTGRFLYMATPDGAQSEGRSGNGLLVFDMDDGHRFVERIDLPVFEQGVRGLTGHGGNGRLYYSTSAQTLGCFDVAAGEVVWQSKFDRGCDRSCITADGKTLYVPTGWWYRGDDSGFLVVDAETGDLRDRITVGHAAHNSIATPDGRYVFLGTDTTLTQFDASDGSVIQTISPVGESGVFPFTVDSRSEFAYVCLGKHVGVDIVDLKTGEVPYRVLAGDEPIGHRTHGAGLTPDESELWISDQAGQKLFIFDMAQMPPTAKGHVDLSIAGHGWVTFSLDGAYAYSHAPEVFDAKTKELVATLKDEEGKPFASSKFIEVRMEDGRVTEMGNEFGLGRAE